MLDDIKRQYCNVSAIVRRKKKLEVGFGFRPDKERIGVVVVEEEVNRWLKYFSSSVTAERSTSSVSRRPSVAPSTS